MSANLELVRTILSGWERGDWSATDWAHPDIEFVVADGPDRRRAVGLDGMTGVWREFLAAWADYAITPEEYRELDSERVYVLLHASGRGKTSGLEIMAERGANIFHISEGRVTRLAIYFDHRNALEDLGLAD
jgi:ketosteroid isomerase-like protein